VRDAEVYAHRTSAHRAGALFAAFSLARRVYLPTSTSRRGVPMSSDERAQKAKSGVAADAVVATVRGRREALQLLGVLGVGALVGCGAEGSGDGGGAAGDAGAPRASGDAGLPLDDAGSAPSDAGSAPLDAASAPDAASPRDAGGTASDAGGAPSCALTAEQEEGPFYVALEMVRSDITDGRATGRPRARYVPRRYTLMIGTPSCVST
jgi:hypothetical protein